MRPSTEGIGSYVGFRWFQVSYDLSMLGIHPLLGGRGAESIP